MTRPCVHVSALRMANPNFSGIEYAETSGSATAASLESTGCNACALGKNGRNSNLYAAAGRMVDTESRAVVHAVGRDMDVTAARIASLPPEEQTAAHAAAVNYERQALEVATGSRPMVVLSEREHKLLTGAGARISTNHVDHTGAPVKAPSTGDKVEVETGSRASYASYAGRPYRPSRRSIVAAPEFDVPPRRSRGDRRGGRSHDRYSRRSRSRSHSRSPSRNGSSWRRGRRSGSDSGATRDLQKIRPAPASNASRSRRSTSYQRPARRRW